MSAPMCRVLIADDHPVFRAGLRAIIDAAPDMTVIGEASTGLEAVLRAAEQEPDVILMDLHMPELDGIEATRRILRQQPGARVLVLTMIEHDDAVLNALGAGARAYVVKGSDRDEVLRAVRGVNAGDAVLSHGIADRLPGLMVSGSASSRAFPELTDRERQVLELLAQGLTNGEIATAFTLSLKTVRNHVSNIFSKIGVSGRAQAIVKAREAGLAHGGRDVPSS